MAELSTTFFILVRFDMFGEMILHKSLEHSGHSNLFSPKLRKIVNKSNSLYLNEIII